MEKGCGSAHTLNAGIPLAFARLWCCAPAKKRLGKEPFVKDCVVAGALTGDALTDAISKKRGYLHETYASIELQVMEPTVRIE